MHVTPRVRREKMQVQKIRSNRTQEPRGRNGTRQKRHDTLLKGWARLHALIALRKRMLMSCVSARHEAMSRLRATPLLSFLDQFNLSARSPLANEPNNLALTLREVEERLPNRTPRARVFLCNSFERDRFSLIETKTSDQQGSKNIDFCCSNYAR